MIRRAIIVLSLLLAAFAAGQRGPEYQDKPAAELKKLAFLLGTWNGHLVVNLTFATGFELNGTLVGSWDMGGHFLKLRGKSEMRPGKSVDVEIRMAYDNVAKSFRGFFFTDGLATGWYAKGNFRGKDLVMRAKAIDAELGEMTVTMAPAGNTVEIRCIYPNMQRRDKIQLTLKRVGGS